MAQYDAYRLPRGAGYLLDCQSDLVQGLSHRLVAPLLPIGMAPEPIRRLNPEFDVEGQRVRMMTQFPASVPKQELIPPVRSLDRFHDVIVAAIDLLIVGV